MKTKDKYQEEKEADSIEYLKNLLDNIFKDENRNIVMISDCYYENGNNTSYYICKVAQEYGILETICEEKGIDYIFLDYTYDREQKRYLDSKFIFHRKEKQKELKRVNSYSKYPHK